MWGDILSWGMTIAFQVLVFFVAFRMGYVRGARKVIGEWRQFNEEVNEENNGE